MMALLSSGRATLVRWSKLVPGLFRHDPLFRYATIAVVLALILMAVSMGQDVSGRRPLPGTTDAGAIAPGPSGEASAPVPNVDAADPPVPASLGQSPAQQDKQDPAIAPSRSLDGLDLAPAPRDNFGTVPQGGKPQ
ncbi:hypothetical protein [Mesorhizobium sp.]|uniref:hypothetical protein n=1 Tax=Mesorhizobium sp. TaxID=1871066 RepID=UPI000FE93B3A|nr:hypothetical protein [Mesorhizobium sp.]RWB66201.1 MAG: hypothetical protein EOQ49_29410 [Mesorhizobium sp.]TIT07845.1 MAG: hypothetical protein E5W74_25200 [Mesorhizobium sp.]TIV80281.1 MAG: hypothetical protein E5V64_20465 [Mesorhizobium sp.]